jgi:hypothetical protein
MEHAFFGNRGLYGCTFVSGKKVLRSRFRSSGVNTYLSSGGIIFHYFVFTAEWWQVSEHYWRGCSVDTSSLVAEHISEVAVKYSLFFESLTLPIRKCVRNGRKCYRTTVKKSLWRPKTKTRGSWRIKRTSMCIAQPQTRFSASFPVQLCQLY